MGSSAATPQGGGGNVGEVAGYWDTVATRTADLNRSTTTILADPQLQANLAVGFYQFELRMRVTSNDTAKMDVTIQTTGTFAGSGNLWGNESDPLKEAVASNELLLDVFGTATGGVIVLKGSFQLTAAGDVTFDWAQNVASGTTTVHRGSTISFRNV